MALESGRCCVEGRAVFAVELVWDFELGDVFYNGCLHIFWYFSLVAVVFSHVCTVATLIGESVLDVLAEGFDIV